MKKKLLVLITISLIPFFFSCEKENVEIKKSSENQISKAVLMNGPIVYSTTFDWEHINQINTAKNIPVAMPWYGSTFIPDRMKHCHPKGEGWEMLYNTLDHNDVLPTYFALYNKYLGVMHLFYIDLTNLADAEAFYTAFCVKGTSSLMNFEGNTNYSVNKKDSYPTIIKSTEGNIVQLNPDLGFIPDKGFVKNSWYAVEVEISYEDVSAFNDSDFYLQYLPFRGNYSAITLKGNLTGTINGTIEGKTSGITNLIGSVGSLFNSTSNNNSVNVGNSTILGTITSSLEKAKTEATPSFWTGLWNKIQTAVPSAAQGAITSTLTSAVNQGIKWATNPLSAFVSTIFSIGGSSDNVPLNKVDLKIDAKITLAGSISSQVPSASCDLRLPNTISTMGGYNYPTLAMKNWNLGVWNVENLPIVKYDIVNVTYKVNGRAVKDPRSGGVSIYIPTGSLAKININPKVVDSCYIIKQTIEYIIDTSDPENKADLDSDNFEPFSFSSGSPGVNSQSYKFPVDDIVVISRPYYLYSNCRFNVYARATLVLKRKTSGKEFVHIKNFPLQYNIKTTAVYQDL